MEFHFVKLNVNGTYLSLVDPNSKHRFMCFPNHETADKCVHYISCFRSKHGVWPSFDMSKGRRKLESSNIKFRSPDQVERFLEIESYDFNTINEIAARSNVSFYSVLRFETNDLITMESISMSGQELDGEADLKRYTDWLNISLKIV